MKQPTFALWTFAAVILVPLGAGMAAEADPRPLAREIDELLARDLAVQGLQPNLRTSDATFVRRIYLDVVGRIPTYRETETFVADTDPEKRAKLIDRLLAGEGYVQHFFHYWADILRLQTNGQQTGGVTGAAYADYLKDSLRTNKPYDVLVRELVSAQGNSWENGAVGYYMRDRGMPLDNMANTVRIFLGTRIECAQCHNHPFDKWTQKQFYQMAAFSFGVQANDYGVGALGGVEDLLKQDEMALLAPLRDRRRKGENVREEFDQAMAEARQRKRDVGQTLNEVRNSLKFTAVTYRDRKQLTLPHDYQYDDARPKSHVTPATMMGHDVAAQPGLDGLQAYAAWMTSKENPRFTTVVANRLWKKVFGAGLIEPVDEMMDSTVASHPGLMKRLEQTMIAQEYDLKAFLRVLFNTETYQREVSREELVAGAPYYFPGPALRRMTAEQLWDSFVTLINPTPDMANERVRESWDRRVDGARFVYESLEAFGADAILAGAEKSASVFRKQAEQVKALQQQLAQARAAKDEARIKEVNERLRVYYRQTRDAVRENVLAPASKQYVSMQKGAGSLAMAAGTGDGAMMEGGAEPKPTMMSGGDGEMKIPGLDRVKDRDRKDGDSAEQLRQWEEEAAYFGITERKDLRQYFKARRQNSREWVRAAEMESPAPRGHYLREFGQSDREVIENANADASVAQVLVLMNSQLLPRIMDRHSALMLSLNKQPYAEDQVKALYVTLLSRQPTDREMALWRKAGESRLTEIEDLIYALINTQQFLFIQ